MSGGATLFLSAEEIEDAVFRLGAAISADHPDGVVLLGVLKGGAILVADLVRAVTVPSVVDFLALSSYSKGAARVRILKDTAVDVDGLDVVLIEDAVDTGLSADYLLGLLRQRGARRVRLCALLDRPQRRIVPVSPEYVGFAAPDTYLVGYGLDLNGRYRNLPAVYALAEPPRDAEPSGGVEAGRGPVGSPGHLEARHPRH